MSYPSDDPNPPSYDNAKCTDEVQILPPATLHVAGRFIYSSDPDAPPLYEVSHSIGFLRDTDRSVKFERLDYSVKPDQNGQPKVTTRQRHIFDLKHPTPGEWPNFSYQAESASRRALCSIGVDMFRPHKWSSKRGYRVFRAVRGSDRRLAGQEIMFVAVPSKEGCLAFEWKDAQDRMLVREVETDDAMSLVISAEMGNGLRDVLVAAWIMRMWWDLASNNYRGKRWEEAKRIMQTPHAELSGCKGGMLGFGRMYSSSSR